MFHVKGRGAVAIGYLRQGAVRVGQQTGPLALGAGPPRVLTVAAVEAVRSHEGGADALGLAFRERPSLEELRLALAPGTLVRFEDPGPGGSTT